MMAAYMIPLKTAIVIFVILVYLLFIPWLIWQYRKYRYFSFWHSLVIFSFIFYSMSALFLVLLPLPLTRDTCSLQSADTIHYVLKPLNSLDNMKALNLNWSSMSSYVVLLKSQAFLQPAFNFLLLFPLGVYIRYFFKSKRNWWKAALITFSVSLFFEITQLTGVYGIYNCAYRLFDVDDLLFNTIGGIVGFLLAPVLLTLLPTKEDVINKSHKFDNIVTPMTQLLALIIDLVFIRMIVSGMSLFTNETGLVAFLLQTILMVIVLIVLPIFWNGKTVGTFILRFHYISLGGNNVKGMQMVKRFMAIYLVYLMLVIGRSISGINLEIGSLYYNYQVFLTVGIVLAVFVMWFVLVIHAIYIVLRKGQRSFYFDKVAEIHSKPLNKDQKKS